MKMNLVIETIPGMGLSVICKTCDGDDRDLLGFYTYTDSLTLNYINDLADAHRIRFHAIPEDLWS